MNDALVLQNRPACACCFKFGRNCEGYPIGSASSSLSTNRPDQTLVPKIKPDLGLSTTRIRPVLKFVDKVQAVYFRYYCEEIAAQLKWPNATSLWEKIVPQSSEAEPFIVHAIVALGALSKSETTHWHRDQSQPPGVTLDADHQYTLLQHGKALQGMRLAIENQTHDKRKSLIACLLVFRLECLLGHQEAASSYASSGVSLFYSCHADTIYPSALVEDDIYFAFSGLDLHTLVFVNKQSLGAHQRLKEDINVVLRLMPATFTKLKESRTFWQLIMRRNLHFLNTANLIVKSFECPDEQSADWNSPYMINRQHPWPMSERPPENIPVELIQERKLCLADIRCWELASADLFSRTSSNPKGEIIMKLLQIHSALTVITLPQTFHQGHPPELVFDDYLAKFTTIVELCTSIKEIPSLSTSSFRCVTFRFDIGVIPAPGATASNCRDIKVRSQATDLLLGSQAYREGVWDAVSVGTVAAWKRDIDGEFMDENGHIPRNRRAKMSNLHLNLQKRMAVATVKQRVGDNLDDLVTRDATLRW